MSKTSKSISHQFPMLLISQPRIWFIHTCDLDMLRHGYSIATYKPEEPTWITMLYKAYEVAGRLCISFYSIHEQKLLNTHYCNTIANQQSIPCLSTTRNKNKLPCHRGLRGAARYATNCLTNIV